MQVRAHAACAHGHMGQLHGMHQVHGFKHAHGHVGFLIMIISGASAYSEISCFTRSPRSLKDTVAVKAMSAAGTRKNIIAAIGAGMRDW